MPEAVLNIKQGITNTAVDKKLRILFMSRASLFTVRGGDTVQLLNTAEALKIPGVHVDIKLCDEKNINYPAYDLIHFFNIRHPADMLLHIERSKLPYVVSTIYVDYTRNSERKISGMKDSILNLFGINAQEYIKTIMKSIVQGEKIISPAYYWKGHKRSVKWILNNAAALLPNSENEYKRLLRAYGIEKKYSVVPNGADIGLFNFNEEDIMKKDERMVLCVARVELIKNQLNLIRALNDTGFQLYLIGDPAPNHKAYYTECKKISSSNIHFLPGMPQEELLNYYKRAKVHVLPSWFETTGLSSLEAICCGCNIVVTKNGDTQDYFNPADCFYCDADSPASIRAAVERASWKEINVQYNREMMNTYNWTKAAEKTLAAYQQVKLNAEQ